MTNFAAEIAGASPEQPDRHNKNKNIDIDMINRVLIRMKVVQLLYSYLLTKSEFKINAAPVNPTRDRSFAHTIYIDLLLLMLEMSGYKTMPDNVSVSIPRNPRFNQSKLMRALAANDEIRSIINKHNSTIDDFAAALPAIYNAVTSSELYKKYLRARNRGTKEDAEFWKVAIRSIILPSEAFTEAARKNPGFTQNGLESGVEDVIATLDDYNDERAALSAARNALDHSLDKAYDLYHALLALPVEITRAYDLRLDNARNKFLPTDQDLNPNTRLLENRLIKALTDNADIREYIDEHPGAWADDELLINHFLDAILSSQTYQDYIALPAPSYQDDCNFWKQVVKTIILPDDELAETLESKSVFWNDDIEIMGTFVIKTLKRFASASGDDTAGIVLPKYKDEEDERFGPELFLNVVDNYDSYRDLIDMFVDGRDWDSERLAFMDVVIMATAIAEMINYPQIPIPVTLNEYIEIANSYSTPKSGKFINGVLYSVINQLKKDGKLLRN